MAECACANLIFTSFIDVVPSLVCMDPRYLMNWSTSSSVFPSPYMGLDWSWLHAVDENVAFVGTDFHVVISSSFIQSSSELLEFFTASQQIDVVSKPQVASGRAKAFCLLHGTTSIPTN